MGQKPFLDRADELDEIRRMLERRTEDNRAIFVAGVSGVGKSALTEEVCQRMPSSLHVRARVVQSSTRYTESGYFVARIAEAFDRVAQSLDATKSFRKHEQKRTLRDSGERLRQTVRRAAARYIPLVGEDVVQTLEQAIGTGRYDSSAAFSRAAAEDVKRFGGYIEEQMERARPILIIENVQTIDDYSLHFLADTLLKQTGQLLILEFTISEAPPVSLWDLCEVFENAGVEITVRELRKLPLPDVASLISVPEHVQSDWHVRYEDWDGNLWPLIRFGTGLGDSTEVQAAEDVLQDAEVPSASISTFVENLAVDQRFVLTAIVAHGGAVQQEDLSQFLNQNMEIFPISGLSECLSALERLEVIETDDSGECRVVHDSAESIFSDALRRESVSLQGLWLAYYRTFLEEQNFARHSQQEVLLRVIQLAVILGDHSAIALCHSKISDVAAQSLEPRRLIRTFIESLRSSGIESDSIPHQEYDNAISGLMKIAYDFRLFREARELSTQMKESAAWDRILAIASQLGDEEYETGAALCRAVLREQGLPAPVRLAVEVLHLVAMRSLNRIDESHQLFTQLLSRYQDSSLIELGYLQRNAEFTLSIQESLPWLAKSISCFRAHEIWPEAVYSTISLANQHVRLGELESARKYYEEAEGLISTYGLERQTLLNNSACLEYFSEGSAERIIMLLNEALSAQQNKFNRVAILHNRAIGWSRYGDNNKAIKDISLAVAMVESGNITDIEVINLIFLHAARLHEEAGDAGYGRHFRSKISGIHPSVRSLWDFRLGMREDRPAEFSFLCKFPYTPVLLAHWLPEFSYL